MLCKDEFVNYGTYGICQIQDIRTMSFEPGHDREYYVLKPVHHHDASVFVPVGSEKLEAKMRPILSKEEIDAIIASVKDDNLLWVTDRKERTAQFKDMLVRRDERELLLLTSCLYLKSQQEAKGLSAGDAQVLKTAESIIRQEFAFSLHIQPEEIGDYIRTRLEA